MTPGNQLDSWKQIADYLHRDVRTAMRWEKERGLPVHRIPGQKRAGVYALTDEIDLWLKNGCAEQVEVAPPLLVASAIGPTSESQSVLVRPRLILTLTTLALAAAGFFWRFAARPAVPRLDHFVQLTSDGLGKGRLAASNSALFFAAQQDTRMVLKRIEADGKQTLLPVALKDFELEDVSADGSSLLLIEKYTRECGAALWLVPVNGSPPRKLSGMCAGAAAFSPDGKELAYTVQRDLYLASSDGSGAQKLLALPWRSGPLSWSPDARQLRLALREYPATPRFWEVSIDQREARQLLPGWTRSQSDAEEDGRWTADGKFFVFEAQRNGRRSLWALREPAGLLSLRQPKPFPLTSNLSEVQQPTPSRDGKKLFATLQGAARGELMRYDYKAGKFITDPDLRISAGHVNYSRDGKRVAYIAYPDRTLWIADANGTNRRQLTRATLGAALPQWSPDDKRIAFMSAPKDENQPTRIYVISAGDGSLAQPVQTPDRQGVPTWTADGSGLLFGENGKYFPIAASCALHRFDFRSGKTFDLPGSTGLWSARACPTGRYIAALTRDNRRLVLYDLLTAAWTELPAPADNVIGDNPSWSRDGKFLYFDTTTSDPAIYRIRIADKRRELVAGLQGIQRVQRGMGLWIGLAPNDVPLLLREFQSQEIYAMDWVTP